MSGYDPAAMMREFTRSSSLVQLIGSARKRFGNPIILMDLAFQLIAITDEPSVEDERWLSINSECAVPPDLLNLDLFSRSLSEGYPVTSIDRTGLTILRMAVQDEGRLFGYLLCPCYHHVPRDEEKDILSILSDFCSVRMLSEHRYACYPKNLPDYFVSDLLNGKLTGEAQILDRARYFSWHLEVPYRVFAIGLIGGKSNALLLKEKMELLQRQLPDAQIFQYGDSLRMLLHNTGKQVSDRLAKEEVSSALNKLGLRAGASPVSWHLGSMSQRNRQAEEALSLGAVLRSEETVLYYELLSVYHCLELCAANSDLMFFCHPGVRFLEGYDREHGTELLETLHGYLVEGRSLTKAAESLHIHRNTLTNRLEKIADLTGVDLEDGTTLFSLEFSIRILEYYGTTTMKDDYEHWIERSPSLKHP